MRQPIRFEDMVRPVLIFGLIGPPIGGIAAALLTSGTAGFRTIPVAMAFSYIFGFVPALLTGLVAGIAIHKFNRIAFLGLVVACGALFSLLFSFLTGDAELSTLLVEPEVLKLTALPGAISAFVLAFLIRLKA